MRGSPRLVGRIETARRHAHRVRRTRARASPERSVHEGDHGHVRHPQPALPAAVRVRLDARAELRAAGRTHRDLRQLLRRQHALHARTARAAHRPATTSCTARWGPLEPFDDSVPEMLSRRRASTPTSPPITSTTGRTAAPPTTTATTPRSSSAARRATPGRARSADPGSAAVAEHGDERPGRQDWINRQYLRRRGDHPQTQTFDAGPGVHRAPTRRRQTGSCRSRRFDPHEPFFSLRRSYQDALLRTTTTGRTTTGPTTGG